MRRKVLQDFANVFCQMFVGWRLHIADDLQRLEQLTSGVLAIDILTAACQHNGADFPPLTIAVEIQAWFTDQLHKHAIPVHAIERAALVVEFQVGIEQRKRRRIRHLQFLCRSQIATAEKVYRSELQSTDTGIITLQKTGTRFSTDNEI
jgi:hypothetical protein